MIAYKLFLLTLCVSQAFALDYYSAMAAPVVAATEGFEKKELGADATTAAITTKSSERKLKSSKSSSGSSPSGSSPSGSSPSGSSPSGSSSSSSSSRRKKTLVAKIEKEEGYFDDISGSVRMIFQDSDRMKFDVSYNLKKMPKECEDDDCYMKVKDGKCDDSDLGDTFHTRDCRVWKKDKTKFTTNHRGRASGMFFGFESGYSYRKNKCQVLVIYGPKEEGSSKIRAIGCGRLTPKGESDDC